MTFRISVSQLMDVNIVWLQGVQALELHFIISVFAKYEPIEVPSTFDRLDFPARISTARSTYRAAPPPLSSTVVNLARAVLFYGQTEEVVLTACQVTL